MCRPIRRLVVLDIGAHSVHVMPLLRSLMHHHGRRWSSRAGISICCCHRLWWASGRHELRMVCAGVHQVRARHHPLGSWDKLWLHHHRCAHLPLLRCVVRVIREAPKLAQLRVAGTKEDWLSIWNLCAWVDLRVCHGQLSHARRSKGLSRVGVHHPVVIIAIWLVRHGSMLRSVHLHRRHMRRLARHNVLCAVLEMERKLMLMRRHLRHDMSRVWSRHARKRLSLKIFLVGEAHG